MCIYCRRIDGHSIGCPNQSEPKIIERCVYCDDPIYIDEEYIETFDGNCYHVDCLAKMKIYELLYTLDVDIKRVDSFNQ